MSFSQKTIFAYNITAQLLKLPDTGAVFYRNCNFAGQIININRMDTSLFNRFTDNCTKHEQQIFSITNRVARSGEQFHLNKLVMTHQSFCGVPLPDCLQHTVFQSVTFFDHIGTKIQSWFDGKILGIDKH